MVLEILLNIDRHLLKNYLNTSTKYLLIIKSFFWTKPYEPGSIILSYRCCCQLYCLWSWLRSLVSDI